MAEENLHRIRRISGTFRHLFSILIIAVPLISIIFWLSFNQLPEGFKRDLPVLVSGNLPLSTILLAILVSAIPTGIILYAFVKLRKLFSLYQQGVIFSVANADCYRSLAYALIYWAFSKLAFIPLLSIVLSMNNPPGQKSLVVSIGSADLSNILIGAIVLLISWVMHEASVMEEERSFTV